MFFGMYWSEIDAQEAHLGRILPEIPSIFNGTFIIDSELMYV
jgi:hypothetical protein